MAKTKGGSRLYTGFGLGISLALVVFFLSGSGIAALFAMATGLFVGLLIGKMRVA